MSSTPREIGTLIVVVLKAKNLPNKRHIGKQNPYCIVVYNGEKRRIRAIRRGGQHPEWDEEVRFTVYEDVEDELARTSNPDDGTPPPLPPKDGEKREKKIKGGKSMSVACYADGPREPDLIGESVVDLTEVLTKGETDEWFTLMHKEKYSGEVYLELTFWSNEKPPEKKASKKATKSNRQYGGPGSFVPVDENASGANSVPASLRSSSSLAQLDLYVPPYTQSSLANGQQNGSVMDQIADEFGNLAFDERHRRESFASYPSDQSLPTESESSLSRMYSMSSFHSQDYGSEDYVDRNSSFSYDRAETPTGHPRPYHRASLPAPGQAYLDYPQSYHSHYDGSQGYSGGSNIMPSVSSGFVTIPTPALSGFLPVQPGVPAPSGFVPATAQSTQTSVYPPFSHQPAPGQYAVPNAYAPATPGPPLPSSSSMGFHPHNYSQSQPQPYFHPTYPHPSSSASPQPYIHPGPPPPSAPPPPPPPAPLPYSHASLQSSSPSNNQQYPPHAPSTPPPPPLLHPSLSQSQQYNPSPPVYNSGSRPLPQPGQVPQHSSLPNTPNGPSGYKPRSPTHYGSVAYSPAPPVGLLPNPPPPPPQLPHTPPNPAYQMNGQFSNGPQVPPPPPLRNPGLPPPLPHHISFNASEPVQGHFTYSPPSGNYQVQLPSGFQPPPPPPISPYPGSEPSQFPIPNQHFYLGPPPRPPQLFDGVHWNANQQRASST